MRAIVCRELGPPSVLRLEEWPEPDMAPGQARVKINADGINFPDILTIEGSYQHKPALPFIAGFETAGEVIEVAPDVDMFAPGDRVMMGVRPGGFAEQAVVDADDLLPTPEPFDVVCTDSFMAQFPDNRREELVAAWHRALRPGGRLVTTNRLRTSTTAETVRNSTERACAFRDAALAEVARRPDMIRAGGVGAGWSF